MLRNSASGPEIGLPDFGQTATGNTEIGPPAGLRPAGGPISVLSR